MSNKESPIILASSSPRRADLLRTVGVTFEVAPSQIQERPHAGEAPADYITRLARAKVVRIARQRQQGLVLGADTIVVLDGKILGKPADEAEAARMLRSLAGRWHAVMTGVASVRARTRSRRPSTVRPHLTRSFAKWDAVAAEPPFPIVKTLAPRSCASRRCSTTSDTRLTSRCAITYACSVK